MKDVRRMVKLEILRGYTGIEGQIKRGDFIVVDERRAADILSNPARARLCPDQPGAPEKRVAGESEKKSSGAPKTGPSIVTPSSSAPGPEKPSSASLAAPASTVIKLLRSGFERARALFGSLQ